MISSRIPRARLLASLARRNASFAAVPRSASLVRPTAVSANHLLGQSSPHRLFATTAEEGDDKGTSEAAAAAAEPAREKLEFQAETRQLLDIVTNSLYTDKEVFLRELVSNASDALEKMRHTQAANTADIVGADLPLEIRIDLDEVTSSITITDTGMGMTRDEMVSNLGTIARSGSKNFIQELKNKMESSETSLDPARGIIGKFGVGFYSAFMVADKVEVTSRSALKELEDQPAKVWSSDGSGTFEIRDAEEGVRQDRGSSIKLFLKSDYWGLIDEERVEGILKRYSNFVGFPIYLNGNRVNTVDAIWTRDPKEVEEEDYSAFYKFIANAVDDPLDICHFRADAPLEIKALFFIPSFHSEKYGMGRMEPGVSLYSRKVLIESKSPDILPDWLRFVKGVVDSEDLPLAISREKAQDSALIAKLKRALTRKFISHLVKMRKNDKEKYVNEFYKEYSYFLKEGICQDYEFQSQLAKLLYFETSKTSQKDIISLDDYIGKMRPEQKDIYYLVAPSRGAALASPYLEAFEKAGVEVIFLFSAIDDFVMGNLESYEGRKLVSVEKGDIDLSELTPEEAKDKTDEIYEGDRELTVDESTKFCNWFKSELGDKKVASCTVTKRLSSSPAIVTDNESGAMRRLMRMVDTSSESHEEGVPLPKQHVEINPKHQVIVGIYGMIEKEPTLARVLAEQVFDNCLVAAGLMDDSRSMLPRLNDILVCVVKGTGEVSASSQSTDSVSGGEGNDASNKENEKDETEKNETKKDETKD